VGNGFMVVALASAQNPYHIQLQGAAAKEIGHQQILRRDRGKLRMLGSQLPNLRWVESGEVDTDGAGIIVIDKINQRLVKVCQFEVVISRRIEPKKSVR